MAKLKATRRQGIGVVLVANPGFGQGWPNIQRQQGNKPGDVTQFMRLQPTSFANVATDTDCRAPEPWAQEEA